MAGDSVPTFVPLDDVSVEVGSPLHVPIDGMDEEGGPLSVTIEIDDPSAVDAVILSGNRSLRLDVQDFGIMTFELFEQRAPRPSSRVIELTESGFYDGIIFHRVVNDFVIQAGDPTGTGTSGSNLGVFDDQFHRDLQHNRGGVLSFAKSSDDTNNSQFFVTHGPTRHLDFNHSIFGQLTEGDDVRQAINEVPLDDNGRPLDDVVIDVATVFDDVENSVIMFRATGANLQTTATITITDSDGNSSQQTINIDTIADQDNASPFLSQIDPVIYAVAGKPLNFQIDATDIEGDDIRFGGQYASDPAGSTASLDPETGEFTITPADDFIGTIDIVVAAFPSDTSSEDLDSQAFQVEFIGPPIVSALSADSDLGVDSSDGLTSSDDLSFESPGLVAGQTVELVNTESDETVATTIADQGRVTFGADSFVAGELADGPYQVALRYLTFGQQGDKQ